MSHSNDAQRCDFCKRGHVSRHDQRLAFRQWTDKGYVFCTAEIPIGICDRCGARHWNADAEAIVEDAVRRAYERLS